MEVWAGYKICFSFRTVKYTNIPKSLINPKHIQQPNNLQNFLNFADNITKNRIITQIVLNESFDYCLILNDDLEFWLVQFEK